MLSASAMRGGIGKKRRYEEEGAKEYRKANKRVQKALKKVKEDWIDTQCMEINACLHSWKKSCLEKQDNRSATIQDKSFRKSRNSQQMGRVFLRAIQL